MTKIHYSRKKRQLERSVKELRNEMRDSNYSPEIINLKRKIKCLLKELSGFVPRYQLRRILGSLAVFFGFTVTSNAQSFLPAVQNPFGLATPVSYLNVPEMADLDNDGDIDIIAGLSDGDIVYYENTGTSTSPAFAAPVTNPFGIVSGTGYIGAPALADLDLDGDLDLLLGKYYGVMTYHENIGTAAVPLFDTGVDLPFGLTATYDVAFPEFVDMDDDGDMDLMVGEYYGNLQYFENIGNGTAPNFTAPIMNPFGLTAGYLFVDPDLADLDYDGDLDLILGEYYGNLSYYENIGTATNPSFAAPQTNPFGLTPTYDLAFPALSDLDGDGDLDIMVGEYYGLFQYFENNDNPSSSIVENEIIGSIDPNPFSDVLSFNFDQDVISAEFVNLAGQSILTIENPKGIIDLSSLKPGMYIVKCTHSNNRQSEHKLQKL